MCRESRACSVGARSTAVPHPIKSQRTQRVRDKEQITVGRKGRTVVVRLRSMT